MDRWTDGVKEKRRDGVKEKRRDGGEKCLER